MNFHIRTTIHIDYKCPQLPVFLEQFMHFISYHSQDYMPAGVLPGAGRDKEDKKCELLVQGRTLTRELLFMQTKNEIDSK